MGKKYVINEESLINIADEIRDKTGNTEALSVEDMASNVNEVYEAGKQAEYDAFWDVILNNGKRSNFSYAFAYWNCETLRPLYKVKATGSINQMFRGNGLLKKIESEFFDLSNAETSETSSSAGNNYLFTACTNLEEIEDIGLKSAYYNTTYGDCEKLKKIAVVRSTDKTIFSNTFRGNISLEVITIEGVIGRNISFSYSPLTIESMKSIITHLKNYAGLTDDSGNSLEYKYTLTLKTSCVTELETADFTDEDKEWLTENGMEYTDGLTWVTVIDNLKWNLVSA